MNRSPLRELEPIAEVLVAAAEATGRVARKKYREYRRVSRGSTPRAGIDTPLWNELAREVEVHLQRYGEKAKLARILGITRQRLHLLVVAKTAFPDAERALQLLTWLQARRRHRHPA
jgi:hypothetical protein